MMVSDSYSTIKSTSQGIYKEKGSRFISYAFPVTNQDEIKSIIDKLRKEHHDARHHCYAYIIGQERNIWRVYDDNEPSGTAGRPILGQIKSFGLTNVFIVVCRYFGGTLLGVSGLINAYRSAAADAINNAKIIVNTVNEFYMITYPYSAMNDVMKILKEEEIIQSDQSFDLVCRITISFRKSLKEIIIKKLSSIENLKYSFISTE
jgi:uncharacterized YigZ family protein